MSYDTAALVIHAPSLLLYIATAVSWLETGDRVSEVDKELALQGRKLLNACKARAKGDK